MKLRTYNKSFIGLMEECDTGAWCKREEVEEELSRKEESLTYYRDNYHTYYLKYINSRKHIAKYKMVAVLCILSLIFNAVLLLEVVK